ncbi:MAG: hypothetical protein CMF54_00630 [Legionellales bacterium]|nr:hypothetical protein [Legionellales bacterium]
MKKKIKYFILIYLFTFSNYLIAKQSSHENEIKLKNIQNRMNDVNKNISNAKIKAKKFEKDIRKNEKLAVELFMQLENTRSEILKGNNTILKLKEEEEENKNIIKKEKMRLRTQIRNIYQIGKYNHIKLLLNQDDLTQINRVIAYHDYDNYARSNRIKNLNDNLSRIKILEKEINDENNNLEILNNKYQYKLNNFNEIRKKRLNSIVEIKNYIKNQNIELLLLKENERDLARLLNKIKLNNKNITNYNENNISFIQKKGKLVWPVKGKLLKKYGVQKKITGLKWQGVLIGANHGSKVHAISDGKVVFADWFKNYGLLVIIDHNNDYLSLYGHNQQLLKVAGDSVKAREIIASVGDSGGQNNSALYFEIRKGKKTLNPSQWCKN